ncbi:MAG TPA: hypothetical protein VJR89_16545 [Polyangiales bacterium]|nr:hypothetical protein [Polyangiales bacterium]
MSPNRLALTALCLLTIHCGGDNEPSVMNGNTSGGTGATPSTPSAGTSSMSQGASGTSSSNAGSTGAAAGKPSSSSGGTTGSMTSANTGASGKSGSGGTPSASGTGANTPAGGTGAAPSAGSGGSTPAGGTGAPSGGSGGSTGGAMGGMFTPLCEMVPPTAAGAQPTKGGACTADDTQLCYKTCGPQSVGFKSETCTSGAYVEQSGCSFPDMDYSCFKIPAMIDASVCPMTAPMANTPCDVAPCTLCNVMGGYLDSQMASKTGYCVCPMAGASGMRKWTCASTTAWPCPAGRGC